MLLVNYYCIILYYTVLGQIILYKVVLYCERSWEVKFIKIQIEAI